MKHEFVWISPAEIHKHWETIKPGVEKVSKLQGTVGWLVEDVYSAVKTGLAHLHLCMRDGTYVGFIVTTNDQHVIGVVLTVWIAYSTIDQADFHEMIMEKLKEWAKNINARSIRFISPRTGWERMAPKLGFKYISSIYELEV